MNRQRLFCMLVRGIRDFIGRALMAYVLQFQTHDAEFEGGYLRTFFEITLKPRTGSTALDRLSLIVEFQPGREAEPPSGELLGLLNHGGGR